MNGPIGNEFPVVGAGTGAAVGAVQVVRQSSVQVQWILPLSA